MQIRRHRPAVLERRRRAVDYRLMHINQRLGRLLVAASAVAGVVAAHPLGAEAGPPPQLSLTPASVAPGDSFEVSGAGCTGDGYMVVVFVDGDAAAPVSPDPDGSWSEPLTVPGDAEPGVYMIGAECRDFDNFVWFSYGTAELTVAAPPVTTVPVTTVPVTTLPAVTTTTPSSRSPARAELVVPGRAVAARAASATPRFTG